MPLVPEIDFGTPASRSEKMVTLTIDGNEITVPEGTSIMRASMEAGIKVPKLCATDMVDAFGSCRLCLVEIEGRNGTPASCTTPVAPGIKVHTQTGRLKDIRKGVMELYISDHPLDCLTCAANGDCELQDMAGAVGLRDARYGYEGENHVFAKMDGAANDLWLAKDETIPYFTYDPSKCIVCNRCMRACEEVQGTFALTISGRGFESRVSPGMNEDFLKSECVSRGACVQACPTATLTEKGVIEIADMIVINKADGDNVGRAKRTAADYQAALNILTPQSASWTPPVLIASAIENQGLDDVWEKISDHRARMTASGEFAARRQSQAVGWMRDMF